MKTLLIATDFSVDATHAADYGYSLAKQIKANLVLCNAVVVPAEIPQAGMVTWPMEEFSTLMEASTEELMHLKQHLEHTNKTIGFKPPISCVNEAGIVTDVVNDIIVNHNVDLVIMETHSSSSMNQFLFGNHSRNMIDTTTKPLMLVSSKALNVPIKKIAFATDFKRTEADLEIIYSIIPLARMLNAEILLTHIYNEKYDSFEFQEWKKQFMTELSNKANYPHIYYRAIKNSHIEGGLDWLCEHGDIDMLAMVHREHGFFDTFLKGSHTRKIAKHISIPLLVFPANL